MLSILWNFLETRTVESYLYMKAAEDPFAELDTLVRALSEIAKPHGYVVEALLDPGAAPALYIRSLGGEWLAPLCEVRPEDGSISFPDRKSEAAALVSKYASKPAWNVYFFCEREALRFPGGSPEELALKAAAGVRANVLSRLSGVS